MKKRNYTLDLLRIILCLFVIGMHTYNYCGCEVYFINITLPVILISADGLFYIISGYFNLEKEFNSAKDIKEFYKNKFLTVLLPFLAFVFVWTVWDYVHLYGELNIVEILSIYYESIMDTAGEGHLWFMYPLFGLLLGTPFISKMLHHMDEKELKVLWYVTLGFNFIDCFLCTDLGIDLRITSWFMNGWPIYYLGGYYYRHVVYKESNLKWAILGLASFILTILGMREIFPFFTRFDYATDFQPLFTIFCMSLFVLVNKAIRINSDKVGKVIVFLSGYTYYIYMYHMRGIEYIVRKLAIESNSFVNWMIVIFGTFAVSLIASIVTKLCLKPVQKLLGKLIVIKEKA